MICDKLREIAEQKRQDKNKKEYEDKLYMEQLITAANNRGLDNKKIKYDK